MEMKLPFKVYVDGRSEEIQNHLFALGCKWGVSGATVSNIDKPFFFVDADKDISYGGDMRYFKEHAHPELTADEVLAIPIEKPAHQFKPFDRVLVRDRNDQIWKVNLYSHKGDSGYHVCACSEWMQCIPYEGNEHLVGTNESPA